jgi:hypothetical protein
MIDGTGLLPELIRRKIGNRKKESGLGNAYQGTET